LHLTAIEVEERHRRLVPQGTGCQAAIKFGEHIFCHRMRVGKWLRADLDPNQFDQLRIRMDHAFDAMGDSRSIRGEEARIKTPHAAGRGDSACDQEQAGRIRQQTGIGERFPGAIELYRLIDLAAQAETGFLAGLADGGVGERPRAAWRDLRTALEKIGLELIADRSRNGNAVVRLVDASARENILARHEHHIVVALADQNFWLVAGAIDQDQRRGILGPKVRVVIGFFFFLYGGCYFGHSIPVGFLDLA